MKATNIAAGTAALAALGLLGAGLSGCSGSVKVETNSTPSVSGADLQTDLTDRLTKAGNPPQSVTCPGDLVGEVGKTVTCDVVFSDTNSVEAILTATKVDGTTVNYDVAPALTAEQLQKAVSGLASTPTVSCDSALEGTVGATATCEVTTNGVASKRLVTVSGVNSLSMDLDVTLVATKQQVEEMLKQKMAADSGTEPENVACVDDIVAKAGNTVECLVTGGGTDQSYIVTVTTIEDDTVNFDYAAKP